MNQQFSRNKSTEQTFMICFGYGFFISNSWSREGHFLVQVIKTLSCKLTITESLKYRRKRCSEGEDRKHIATDQRTFCIFNLQGCLERSKTYGQIS